MSERKWMHSAVLVRRTLKEEELSREDLSKILGTTRQFVDALVRGSKCVSPRLAIVLSKKKLQELQSTVDAYLKDTREQYTRECLSFLSDKNISSTH